MEKRKSSLQYLLYPIAGDHEIIVSYKTEFEQLSNDDLIKRYNRSVEIGIVGVRQQSLMIFALGVVFMKRFGKSPVTFEQNLILGLSGEIKADGDSYVHVNNN